MIYKNNKSKLTIASAILTIGILATSTNSAFAEIQPETVSNLSSQSSFAKTVEKINRTVKNIDKGIEITMTSNDSEIVKKLQDNQINLPNLKDNEKISKNKTNIENGIKVTITSDEQQIVKKLQSQPRIGKKIFKKIKQNQHFIDKEIQHKVENINDGIKITITSTNTEKVKKIQSHENPPMLNNEKINISKKNLDNGIEITATSTDSSMVSKLQSAPGKIQSKLNEYRK